MPGELNLPSLRFLMLLFSSLLSFNTGNLVLACLNRIMTIRTIIYFLIVDINLNIALTSLNKMKLDSKSPLKSSESRV